MALNINWTAEAKLTYGNILEYLQEEWSIKEVQGFINRTEKVIQIISQQPYIFKASAYQQNSPSCYWKTKLFVLPG